MGQANNTVNILLVLPCLMILLTTPIFNHFVPQTHSHNPLKVRFWPTCPSEIQFIWMKTNLLGRRVRYIPTPTYWPTRFCSYSDLCVFTQNTNKFNPTYIVSTLINFPVSIPTKETTPISNKEIYQPTPHIKIYQFIKIIHHIKKVSLN